MPDPVDPAPYLDHLHAEAKATRDRVAERFGPLTEEQRRWRPPEGGWGIADCLAHLTITDTGYLDNLERSLAGRTRGDAAPPFKPGPLATKFIRMLEPDAPRRLKAPKRFRPEEGDAPAGTLGRYLETQDRLLKRIQELHGFDLTRIKVASPVSGLLRFRTGDALRLMVVHDKRHVAQAERVLARDDFPAGSAGD